MGGTNTKQKRGPAFGAGGNPMQAANMAANAGKIGTDVGTSGFAQGATAFGAAPAAGATPAQPQQNAFAPTSTIGTDFAAPGANLAPPANPTPAYNSASNAAMGASGIATPDNWTVNAKRGWTLDNTGNYTLNSSPLPHQAGSQYSFDKDTGWTSLDGFTGPPVAAANPAQMRPNMRTPTYMPNDVKFPGQQQTSWQWDGNSFEPIDVPTASENYYANLNNGVGTQEGRRERAELTQDRYGIDMDGLRSNFRDWGIDNKEAKDIMAMSGQQLTKALEWGDQYNRNPFDANGRPITGTGYYSGAADGVSNNRLEIAMGLKVPRELQQYMNGSRDGYSEGWVPNGMGGYIQAPDLMNENKINRAAMQDALTRFGYQKPQDQNFGTALQAGYGNAVLDTSGLGQTPFAGGFTTGAFTGPPQVLAPPSQQDLRRMYKPGGANYIKTGGQ